MSRSDKAWLKLNAEEPSLKPLPVREEVAKMHDQYLAAAIGMQARGRLGAIVNCAPAAKLP